MRQKTTTPPSCSDELAASRAKLRRIHLRLERPPPRLVSAQTRPRAS
jgi:hypothetical protein